MKQTTFQHPEIRDANDNIIQQGSYGKTSPLVNSTNDGVLDYINNNLEALYDAQTAAGNAITTGGLTVTGDVDITGDLSVSGAITGKVLTYKQKKFNEPSEWEDNTIQSIARAFPEDNPTAYEYGVKVTLGKIKNEEGHTNLYFPHNGGMYLKNYWGRDSNTSGWLTMLTDQNYSQFALPKNGTAVKATADAAGNNIQTTYAKKSDLTNYLPLRGGTVTGGLTVEGTITGNLAGNADTATNAEKIDTDGGERDLITAKVATSDKFRLRVGGSSNKGWVELATGDDAEEPIYVRQYTWGTEHGQIDPYFGNLKREAALLDSSGNTYFPGTVTAPNFTGLASNATNDANGNPIAGTYLPLSGGKMTGSIQYVDNGKIFTIGKTIAGNVDLCWDLATRKGAGLALRSTDYSSPGEFMLFARDANNSCSLEGKPDGTLTWDNKEIERVSAKGTYGIRFESGIQICWGELSIPAGTAGREVSGTMTFPYPFANTNYVLTFGNDWLSSSSEYYRAEGRNTANFKFTAVGVNTNSHKAFYIAIGYWK